MVKRGVLMVMVLSAVMAVVLAAGCGFLRDLSTPAARLVGHWTTDKGDDYYFGRQVAGEGTLIVLPKGGEKVEQTYEVLGQNQEEDTVTVVVAVEGGPGEERVYRIPEDGIFMREQSEDVPDEEKTEYIFVDTRTDPAPYMETLQAKGED